VLGEVHLDELGERRRLHQALLAPQLLEHALERLRRGPLRLEVAPLHAPGTAAADPVPVRPPPPITARTGERKHLPLLRHLVTSLAVVEVDIVFANSRSVAVQGDVSDGRGEP
jgi:hypothetical protein